MAMREVLYRGKSDGKWYFGDLWHLWDGRLAIRLDGEAYPIAIDPETRGEFTGLTDKNGTKIFEGDILEFINTYRQINNKWTCVVEFLDGAYICRYIEKEGHLGDYNHFCSWSDSVSYEVIGNVYDNPELIGGEENGKT